jgi:hypothetical protein
MADFSSDDSDMEELLRITSVNRPAKKTQKSPNTKASASRSILQQALQDEARSMNNHRVLQNFLSSPSTRHIPKDDDLKASVAHVAAIKTPQSQELKRQLDEHDDGTDDEGDEQEALSRKTRVNKQKMMQALQAYRTVSLGSFAMIEASPVVPYLQMDNVISDIKSALSTDNRLNYIVTAMPGHTVIMSSEAWLGMFLYEGCLYREIKRSWSKAVGTSQGSSPWSTVSLRSHSNPVELQVLVPLCRYLLRLASSHGYISSLEVCEGARKTLLSLVKRFQSMIPADASLIPFWSAWLQVNSKPVVTKLPKSEEEGRQQAQLVKRQRHAAIHSFKTVLEIHAMQDLDVLPFDTIASELATLLVLRLDVSCHTGQVCVQDVMQEIIYKYLHSYCAADNSEGYGGLGSIDERLRNVAALTMTKIKNHVAAFLNKEEVDQWLSFTIVSTLPPRGNIDTWLRLQAHLAEQAISRCLDAPPVVSLTPPLSLSPFSALPPTTLELFLNDRFGTGTTRQYIERLVVEDLAWRAVLTSCHGLHTLLEYLSSPDFVHQGTRCLAIEESAVILLETGLNLIVVPDNSNSTYFVLMNVLEVWMNLQAQVNQRLGPWSSQPNFQRSQYRLQVMRTAVTSVCDRLRRKSGMEERALVQQNLYGYFQSPPTSQSQTHSQPQSQPQQQQLALQYQSQSQPYLHYSSQSQSQSHYQPQSQLQLQPQSQSQYYSQSQSQYYSQTQSQPYSYQYPY